MVKNIYIYINNLDAQEMAFKFSQEIEKDLLYLINTCGHTKDELELFFYCLEPYRYSIRRADKILLDKLVQFEFKGMNIE